MKLRAILPVTMLLALIVGIVCGVAAEPTYQGPDPADGAATAAAKGDAIPTEDNRIALTGSLTGTLSFDSSGGCLWLENTDRGGATVELQLPEELSTDHRSRTLLLPGGRRAEPGDVVTVTGGFVENERRRCGDPGPVWVASEVALGI